MFEVWNEDSIVEKNKLKYFNKFDEDLNKELNNIDKMKAIESWQGGNMHPLTCTECRRNLYEDIVNKEIVLKCICGHVQEYVPEIVYTRYKKLLIEGMK
ncbi:MULTISPECIES: hypothetical protein [Clostridium]|uniref:Uncharacterized protein n=1 Tax=Clostridium sporogenes TaxID=1509 RepID=A0AAE6IBE6_CLOSG|nr:MULTISPECIES: hypothetical protein [Clostridium]APQ78819.1 hypothetical protein RSJ10_3916 [Clostridium botulinum]MBN3355961.1 hypothetical protein [Clostridium botulinum]QDY34693.1 hypothetical protein CGS26_20595 [Clostridium sporogenes]